MSRKAVRVFNWKGIFYYTIYDDGVWNCEWDGDKFIDWYNSKTPPNKIRQKNWLFYYHLGRVVQDLYKKYLKDE